MLLLSALVGGALTWLLLQGIYPMFAIPEELRSRRIWQARLFLPNCKRPSRTPIGGWI